MVHSLLVRDSDYFFSEFETSVLKKNRIKKDKILSFHYYSDVSSGKGFVWL